ncbi:hypothetical protein [Yoonia sp. I 8.24]|uniref:NYN domain-containing protein n=1 Tax=Yoonia sp. I 8.24 TaxID=1537229 RepID=UPI001EDE740B|nr:hypothetical protein [Yoonia sp. I 8.24]MCG3267774.1 hypothetical protein [Yoonia sp. I 8.24]
MTYEPKTLGDKLALITAARPKQTLLLAIFKVLIFLGNLGLFVAVCFLTLLLTNVLPSHEIERDAIMTGLMVFGGVWVLFILWQLAERKRSTTTSHGLLKFDRQGFMRNLRLDAKTAIIDGSNIYHFGHEKKVDAQPLGMLAHALREEGYRIVCFFDANIYFTLIEHGAFSARNRHELGLLIDIFGLRADEIYIVPSGVQADDFILESLHQLPISFAVTNDLYRDYAQKYPDVMQSKHWRKGVVLTKNEVKLRQHAFAQPLRIAG